MEKSKKSPEFRVRLEGAAPLLHPLGGCSFTWFWRHWAAHWPCSLRSAHAQLFSMSGVLLRQSAVARERMLHAKAIRQARAAEGPIFVVGHWRSGTTYLHNLLASNASFGTISFSESVMPLDFLSRFRPAHDLMRLLMPSDRGVDGVEIGIDTPQEEEMALAAIGGISFFLSFYFPRQLERHFRRAVLLEGVGPAELERLRESYRFLERKIAYARGCGRVLFKNPACSGRLRFLTETFPDARFVHIVRNPYEVYPSMLKLWRRLFEAFAWQDPAPLDLAETTLSVYERTMRRHLAEREGIEAERYHEVRFEDLERDPLAVVEGIYEALGMDFSPEAEAPARRLIEANAGYRKNRHVLGEAERASIAERWGFALEEWGYGEPGP